MSTEVNSEIIWTEDQVELLNRLDDWYPNARRRNKMYYSYSGRPGTGKTTVINEFVRRLGLHPDEYVAAAYVGKAVLVLLRHGVPASTIHSLIYAPTIVTLRPYTKDNPTDRVVRKMVFQLRESLKQDPKLIIVDEAGQVNDKMLGDLLSFGIPVVFIGDKDQLPPVFGICSVMLHPDFVLRQIMRQALDDPIVTIADDILEGVPLQYGTYGLSKIVPFIDWDEKLLTEYDIVICGTNRTREALNQKMRELRGIVSPDPVFDDKMICRQNCWDQVIDGIPLTNGLVGYITNIDRAKIFRGHIKIDFEPDFMEESFINVPMDMKYLHASYEERRAYGMSQYTKFEYGYAITAYLCQGSEYENVLYIDEPLRDRDKSKKQIYTAVTRAKTSVTVVKAPDRRYSMNIWDY